jgi:hypothetical protein
MRISGFKSVGRKTSVGRLDPAAMRESSPLQKYSRTTASARSEYWLENIDMIFPKPRGSTVISCLLVLTMFVSVVPTL